MPKTDDLNRLFFNRLLDCAYPCPSYPTDMVAEYPLDAPESWSLMRLVEAGADPFGSTQEGIPFLHLALSTLDAGLAEAVAECQLRRVAAGDESMKVRWAATFGVDALGRTRLVTLLQALLSDRWEDQFPLPDETVARLLSLSLAINHATGSKEATTWARDATSREQWTPIHLAARLPARLAVPVIHGLLENGAPKTLRDDREGLTALEWIERQIKLGDTGAFCFSFEDEEGLHAIAAALR